MTKLLLSLLVFAGAANAGIDRIGGDTRGSLPFLGSFSIHYTIRNTLMYEISEIQPQNMPAFIAYMKSSDSKLTNNFYRLIDPTVEKYMQDHPQASRDELERDAAMMVDQFIAVFGEALLVRPTTKETLRTAVVQGLKSALLGSDCENNARN